MAVQKDITFVGNINYHTDFSGAKAFRINNGLYCVFYNVDAGLSVVYAEANSSDVTYGSEYVIGTKKTVYNIVQISDTLFAVMYEDSGLKLQLVSIVEGSPILSQVYSVSSNTVTQITATLLSTNKFIIVFGGGSPSNMSSVVVSVSDMVCSFGPVFSIADIGPGNLSILKLSETMVLYSSWGSTGNTNFYVLDVNGNVASLRKTYSLGTGVIKSRYSMDMFLRIDGQVDMFAKSITAGLLYYRFTVDADGTLTRTVAVTYGGSTFSSTPNIAHISDYDYFVQYNYYASARHTNSVDILNTSGSDIVSATRTWTNTIDSSNQALVILNPNLAVSMWSGGNPRGTRSVPVTIGLTGEYDINLDITGVLSAEGNPSGVAPGGTADLTFVASAGYILPLSVTVTGAAFTWDATTGVLHLYNPYSTIDVKIEGVEAARPDIFALFLYRNTAERNRVDKTLYLEHVTDIYGTLRDGGSITGLTITIMSNVVPSFNYVYIPLFNRYYFVDDLINVNNRLWDISLSVDVLMSYKSDILEQTAFINRNETEYNPLLIDNCVAVEQGKEVDIITGTTTFVNEYDVEEDSEEGNRNKCRILISGTGIGPAVLEGNA